MFSISETTLSILKALQPQFNPDLYAIAPYAYEYVRMATRTGGISGLATKVIRQIVFSPSIINITPNLLGLIRGDPKAFLKTYLVYEISRIKSAAGKNVRLQSILLHEIITDMALAFNLEWFFKAFIAFLSRSTILPGFETRNFAYLVNKFIEWEIDLSDIVIAAPFNKIGFQMNPSKVECEQALAKVSRTKVIAMSILAAGYLEPSKAIEYCVTLPNISHIVVGVSKEHHARQTFRLLRQGFDKPTHPYSTVFNPKGARGLQ